MQAKKQGECVHAGEAGCRAGTLWACQQDVGLCSCALVLMHQLASVACTQIVHCMQQCEAAQLQPDTSACLLVVRVWLCWARPACC